MIAKPINIPYRNIRDIFEVSKARRKETNSTFYSSDTPTRYVYYVEEGAVRIFDYPNDEKKTKNIIFKKELFGIEGVFGEKYHHFYAEPLTKVVHYRTLPISAFELKLKIDYGVCHDFFAYLETRKRTWHNRFLIKSYNKREILIIRYLEELAAKVGKPVGLETLISIVPTHHDMAGILGTSRQTVTQVLRRLHEENAIYYDRRRLIIRNADGKIPF